MYLKAFVEMLRQFLCIYWLTYLDTPGGLATFLVTTFLPFSLCSHSLSAVRSGKPVSAFSWLHNQFRGLCFGCFPTRSSLYSIFLWLELGRQQTWLNYCIYFLLIMSIIVFSTCFICLFWTWSHRVIPSMLLRHFISNTFNFLLSSFTIVHVSPAYTAIGIIKDKDF